MAGRPYLRLRQICLVAPDLAAAVAEIETVLGLSVCFRDHHVGIYGLENALFPLGHDFLEVVAPTKAGTAAGRFLEKSKGYGGYMAIFDCDDPRLRGDRAAKLGVRTANLIEHAPYLGVQLHPRDCGAAMIEFNHTEGGEAESGPYNPAGPDWQSHARKSPPVWLDEVELQSPEPGRLARHWGGILDLPVAGRDRSLVIDVEGKRLRFVAAADGGERLSALTLILRDADRAFDAARKIGLPVEESRVRLCGVDLLLREARGGRT